ncbi:MAG: hypothetical protein ABFD54_13655 [Armatimonadota bacterium]|nr:hypothetical protein [bacterium]
MNRNCVALILALCLIPAIALANGYQQNTGSAMGIQTSQPAAFGAGQQSVFRASSVSNQAYLVPLDTSGTITPQPITGAISMVGTLRSATAGVDTGNVAASFNYNSQPFTVRFTNIGPISGAPQGFSGVGIMSPVFGNNMSISGVNLPPTNAYGAISGQVTISSGAQTIATNQNAIALVTPALHDAANQPLSTADNSSQEIYLIVPGPIVTSAASSLPSNGFYAYWPGASYSIGNTSTVLSAPPIVGSTPAMVGRGPAAEVTPLRISITNNSINMSQRTVPYGLYEITIVNNSSKPRGLYMTGRDLCCTQFNRYSRVLKPGGTQTFRFFFAPGTVQFRDLTECTHGQRTCELAHFGKLRSSVTFQ